MLSADAVNLDHKAQEAAHGVPKAWWREELWVQMLEEVQIITTARAALSSVWEVPHLATREVSKLE